MSYEVNTTIPNYKVHPLSEEELDLVAKIEKVAADGQNALLRKNGGRGMMLEVEMAALLLAHVLDHADRAADDLAFKRSWAQQYTITLVVRRAREIHGQGTT